MTATGFKLEASRRMRSGVLSFAFSVSRPVTSCGRTTDQTAPVSILTENAEPTMGRTECDSQSVGLRTLNQDQLNIFCLREL